MSITRHPGMWSAAFMRKLSVVLAICLGLLEVWALWRARWVQHRTLHRAQRRALG